NDGNVNGAVTFINFPSLQGGTGNDTFTFTTGSLTGSIDGGLGTNTVNLAAGEIDAGASVLGGTFTNVTNFVGDNTADTLVGTNAVTTWTISGANDGSLSTGFTFTDIANLTGGTANDTFTFTTGSLTGSIDGGLGTNTINIAAVAGANTIDLAAGEIDAGASVLGGTFTNVTNFVGDNTADTLVGTNAVTTWTISGANDGSLSTGFTFTDIANLTGGTANDTFTFTTGSLTGSIDGGLGTNTINIAAVAGANT